MLLAILEPINPNNKPMTIVLKPCATADISVTLVTSCSVQFSLRPIAITGSQWLGMVACKRLKIMLPLIILNIQSFYWCNQVLSVKVEKKLLQDSCMRSFFVKNIFKRHFRRRKCYYSPFLENLTCNLPARETNKKIASFIPHRTFGVYDIFLFYIQQTAGSAGITVPFFQQKRN